MRTTLAIQALLACVSLACAAADGAFDVVAARREALARPRPIVYNTDGCDVLYWPTGMPVSVEAFMNRRLKYALGTRITTVAYCPQSAGFNHFTCRLAGEPLTNSVTSAFHGLDDARNAAADFFALGTDPLEMASSFCRANNLEVFVSIRVNDQHDAVSSPQKGYSALFPPFKKAHPEFLMGDFDPDRPHKLFCREFSWSCVDFTHIEVRERMKKFVREFLERYDVDGIEYDFNRHLILFRSVAEGGIASAEECDLMTGLMRDLRGIANEVSRRKRRSILVVMRAPDSKGFDRDCGIDLERWFKEGLVDIWIGGGYFRLAPWEESVALAHRYGVKFYASIDESRIERYCARNGLPCIPGRTSIAAYAACFANAMSAGADGVYTFNLEKEMLSKVARLDGAHSAGQDKIYFLRYRGAGGYRPDHWLKGGFRHDKLPRLDPGRANEPDFPVYGSGGRFSFSMTVGDDFKTEAKGAKVAALALTNLANPDGFRLRVNGSWLKSHESFVDGLFRFSIPVGCLRRGVNEFEVAFPGRNERMRIHDFALEVSY